LLDVTAFDETVPDWADAVNCDDCDELAVESVALLVLVVVAVAEGFAVADDGSVVAAFAAGCVPIAMAPTSAAATPALSAPAARRLRRAGCIRRWRLRVASFMPPTLPPPLMKGV